MFSGEKISIRCSNRIKVVKIMNSSQKDQYIQIKAEHLQALMGDLFTSLVVPLHERAILIETLMEASLAGYNSHGIMRLPVYAQGIRQGDMIPGAEIKHLRETPASAYLDGRFGLGPVVATAAMELASEKATQTGIGCVSVINCNDVARLGSYVIKPAQQGLVALMVVNDAGGGPRVVPWGGVDPFLSTNPIAAGIPWQGDMPMIIDVSTSVVSLGQLKTMAARGETPPDGLLIDKAGNPTQDLKGFFAEVKRSMLLPLGGLVAGHKGFALSLLVEVLAGALSGAGCSMFVSRAQFNQSVERLIAGIKESQPASYVDEILIPGERTYQEKQRRLAGGIPVEKVVWAEVQAVMEEVNVAI